jgi:hypothetical protein
MERYKDSTAQTWMWTYLITNAMSTLTSTEKVIPSIFHNSLKKNYCCAGWGYIVAFTKVLIIYQIYHN